MNIDQSIHRMALRETESLGVAQLLVARKRQELDLRLLREQVQKGEATTGANVDDALRRMDEESQAQSEALVDDAGVLVDKTA
ncbi:MAG TPA: hypothetical protein VGN80_04895 [Devosiaceae bacterium]|jgi:hypothetical protein|nr:hypothetical protein [Devosiaceae bacterium]